MEGNSPKRRLSARRIALPTEHGSWGILSEPIVASLAVAPSPGGFFIALGVAGIFLLRQPLRVLGTGLLNKGGAPDRLTAGYFSAAFGLIAIGGFTGAAVLAAPADLLPLAALVPLGIYQLINDVSRKSRELVPELVGAAALSASAPAIALVAGWPLENAAALWILFVARSVPSFVYVRQRLRLEKGKVFLKAPPAVLHGLALGVCGALAYAGLTPYLPIAVFAFLLWRSLAGLSGSRKKLKAIQLGIRETIYGGVLVLSVVLGYYLGI